MPEPLRLVVMNGVTATASKPDAKPAPERTPNSPASLKASLEDATEALAEDGSMLTTVATLQELYATDLVTYIGLYLRDPATAGAVAADLQRALAGADAAPGAPEIGRAHV